MKLSERELELRRRREEAVALAELEAAREAEFRRLREEHYRASRNKVGNVTKRMDTVTKLVEGKRGRGRPSLSGVKMTDAERSRRYRARKKHGAEQGPAD
jgi:hypothetical protein